LLLDEIVQLKKEKELLDRTLVNKDAQLVDVQQHLEMTESSCRSTENKQRLIESQVHTVNLSISCIRLIRLARMQQVTVVKLTGLYKMCLAGY